VGEKGEIISNSYLSLFSTPKGDGTFNVYEDIKNKLVEKGVPPEEIAFIHEANTELRKAELFGKVRSGQVRFLLGSTQKMGAGTNVQDRLIALHHLDVPWRPSEEERARRYIQISKSGHFAVQLNVLLYPRTKKFPVTLAFVAYMGDIFGKS